MEAAELTPLLPLCVLPLKWSQFMSDDGSKQMKIALWSTKRKRFGNSYRLKYLQPNAGQTFKHVTRREKKQEMSVKHFWRELDGVRKRPPARTSI
jgi:hypothetical protein